jgi:hypothetical protein
MEAEPLRDYIKRCHGGNNAAFARAMGLKNPQSVTPWIRDGWIVFEGKLYSPKRDIAWVESDSPTIKITDAGTYGRIYADEKLFDAVDSSLLIHPSDESTKYLLANEPELSHIADLGITVERPITYDYIAIYRQSRLVNIQVKLEGGK